MAKRSFADCCGQVRFRLASGREAVRSVSSLGFALLTQDNMPYSACLASADTAGCVRGTSYACKPESPHSRHFPPLRSHRAPSGAAKGGAAQEGTEEAHLSEGEEAPRGVERRAERHAATRFVACAAEHAARRGGRIRPTMHRGAKRSGGDGSGDAGSGSEAETGRGRDEHPRCHGRQVSPPPAGHTEADRGGLRRTATRRRICIRREYPPSAKREPRSGR